VNFKLCVLVYRCLRGLGPEYFSEDFRLVLEIQSRQRLRSASSTDVVVPATRRSSLGDRAFPVAGARAWNAFYRPVSPPHHHHHHHHIRLLIITMTERIMHRPYLQSGDL